MPRDGGGLTSRAHLGVLLFGSLDVMGTDLEAGFKQALIPVIKEAGGDGAVRVRVRYQLTQYAPGPEYSAPTSSSSRRRRR
ncbi:MAG: hypothetical protein FJ086_18505 [Deltaproteobacteria bacterium]|nr:hypothetical protein [Deltaproteobacteria bacterium]